jgi:1,4-dihydroxy-6-naphthoate synthase
LGKGVGPLLIGKQQADGGLQQMQEQVNVATIAIPGEDTTAHFLFAQAFPNASHKIFRRFNEIEQYVAEGKGPGVIIHENRFTYQQKGLHKWVDLGEYWEASTGNPIPLGGIVMKRSIETALAERIDSLIRQSLEYAFEHYPEVSAYVRQHAQEMSDAVMRQHIDLYVNDFSIALGESGKAAILEIMKTLSGKSFEAATVFAKC